MLRKLGQSLKRSLRRLTKRTLIDEEAINELVKDMQRSLLEADVNVKLVFKLSERIRERACKEKPIAGLSTKEHLIRIVYEELVNILGAGTAKLAGNRCLLVGLFGSGKTSTCAKLAKYLKVRGKKVALVGCDVRRPAAAEQLEQLASKAGVSCWIEPDETDSKRICANSLENLQADCWIVDSSGRDAIDKQMIKEIKDLAKFFEPDEILLVISADLGQQAKKQAKAFKEAFDLSGVIVTKLDATAKGGAALASCNETGTKVKFITTGEALSNLEEFDPESFVSRLIGYGDLKSLARKAKEAGIEKVAEKAIKGEFTMDDFAEQLQSFRKMGSFRELLERIPGFGKLPIQNKQLHLQEEKLDRWQHALNSMTPREKINPKIINSSRIQRIAKGAGLDASEIRELLTAYRQSRKMIKIAKKGKFRQGKFRQLAKQLGL